MLRLFNGKRVLVTGDTGFKGSWLALWLHELGAEVLGVALPPQRSEDHFHVAGLKELILHKDVDIRDAAALMTVFREFRPEFVFHLAAQSLVRLSYIEPKITFDTNMGGSVNVLEAIRHTDSIRGVIFVTSDKCYRNREWVWGYRESDELGGHDPYSASKAGAEIIFSAYQLSFFHKEQGVGTASVRAGNVIGGGDWSLDRLVPDCIRSLQEKRSVLVRNPTATRPWQHVLDPLYGYLTLAARLAMAPAKYSGAWNFGPDHASIRCVSDLADSVIEAWGPGSVELSQPDDAPHEAQMLHLNCDKARQELGWYPLWDFDRGVHETVRWYKQRHEGRNALDLSHEQVRAYMSERQSEHAEVAIHKEAIHS